MVVDSTIDWRSDEGGSGKRNCAEVRPPPSDGLAQDGTAAVHLTEEKVLDHTAALESLNRGVEVLQELSDAVKRTALK